MLVVLKLVELLVASVLFELLVATGLVEFLASIIHIFNKKL